MTMVEYTENLKVATAQLAASQAQLDQAMRELPPTLSAEDYKSSIAKLKRQHNIHKSRIKYEYSALMHSIEPEKVQEFALFPKLSQSLQGIIWKLALPGPRIVPILRKETEVDEGLISPCASPAMLHVCRASRQIALESGYQLAFSTATVPATIYFNFKIDTVYIDDAKLFGDWSGRGYDTRFLSQKSTAMIKNLAIGINVLSLSGDVDARLASRISTYFPSLESLSFTAFLSYEWLRYGETNVAEFHESLIPYLGRQSLQWRTACREHQPKPSLETVHIALLTNTHLYPWMTRKVQANWDGSIIHHCKTSPEYTLDPAQTIAVTHAKLAPACALATACDATYAEQACGSQEQASSSPSQARISSEVLKRALLYPAKFFERLLSNSEMDAGEEKKRAGGERKRREGEDREGKEALRRWAVAKEGPVADGGGGRVEGKVEGYKEIRFVNEMGG